MARLRDFLGTGVGHHEARHWHRRVYSGMVSLLLSAHHVQQIAPQYYVLSLSRLPGSA